MYVTYVFLRFNILYFYLDPLYNF